MPKALHWWGLVMVLVALPGTGAFSDPAGGGIGGLGIHPGGIGGTGIQPGGIGGTGITALGVIQRFGSIYVNGREYILSPQTRYSVDGAAGTAKDLRLGDRVTVQAAANGQAIAQEVRVDHAVIGRVKEVDAAKRQFIILGETLQANEKISIAVRDSNQSLPFKALQAGDIVSVSGLNRGSGYWLATAITRLYPADAAPAQVPLLLRGQVSALDPGQDTLAVGATRLRVNGALLQPLRVGQSVVVRGTYTDGQARVESVTPAALAAQDVGNRVSLVGYLARGDNGWTTHGVSLVEGSHTLYENGGAADMRAGSMVAVEGRVQAPGVVNAERVIFSVNPMDFDFPIIPRMPVLPPVLHHPEIERPEFGPPEIEPLVERPELPDND